MKFTAGGICSRPSSPTTFCTPPPTLASLTTYAALPSHIYRQQGCIIPSLYPLSCRPEILHYTPPNHLNLNPRRTYHSTTVNWLRIPDADPTELVKAKKPFPTKTKSEKKKEYKLLQLANQQKNEVAQNSGLKRDWQIKSAIILERPQAITPLPEPWLVQYDEWRKRWDWKIIEQYPPITILDEDVEILKQQEEDKKRREKEKAKEQATETEEEKAERLEREEREARMKAIRDSHQYKIEVKARPRQTEADHKNDVRSVYRKLDEKLFLIVQKNRNEHKWHFPQAEVLGESLRETVNKLISEHCNKNTSLETFMVGNAPVGFYSYPYQQSLQKKISTYGAKVFYLYGYYVNGTVSLSQKYADYAWVTKNELEHYLEDTELYTYLRKMIPDDGKHELLSRHMPNYAERKKEQTAQ